MKGITVRELIKCLLNENMDDIVTVHIDNGRYETHPYSPDRFFIVEGHDTCAGDQLHLNLAPADNNSLYSMELGKSNYIDKNKED